MLLKTEAEGLIVITAYIQPHCYKIMKIVGHYFRPRRNYIADSYTYNPFSIKVLV